MKIIIGTHIHETPRLGLFLDSINKLPNLPAILCYALHSEGHLPKTIPAPFERTGMDIRIASQVIPGSKSDKPLVNDMFTRLALLNPNGYFLFVNSDVELCPAIFESIAMDWKSDTKVAALYRYDYGPAYGNTLVTGQDGFFVESRWWLQQQRKFEDIPNVLGEPAWDNAFTCTMMDIAGQANVLHFANLLYHRVHVQRWTHEGHDWQTYLAKQWINCPSRGLWESFDVNKILQCNIKRTI